MYNRKSVMKVIRIGAVLNASELEPMINNNNNNNNTNNNTQLITHHDVNKMNELNE